MNYEYVFPKKEFNMEEIEKFEVYFRNGDLICFDEATIVDNLEFYDELIDVKSGYAPFVRKGTIKLKISNKKPEYDRTKVYDQKEYKNNRKQYVETRCVIEGGLYFFKMYNSNNWHHLFFGDAICRVEKGFLFIEFQENRVHGSYDSEFFLVKKAPVSKKDTVEILLDFENCEGINVYADEIVRMRLNYGRELEWGSGELYRIIKGGFIDIKFKRKRSRSRTLLFSGKPTIRRMTKRLCGKGIDDIDICHLYITHNNSEYDCAKEEIMEVPDFDWDEIEDLTEDLEEGCWKPCISGYAEKQKNGVIHIVFGKRK